MTSFMCYEEVRFWQLWPSTYVEEVLDIFLV
jgi:hypothetical protein